MNILHESKLCVFIKFRNVRNTLRVFLQAAGKFNVEVVQRQLRYTGMLATVQIRQAGYNYRLTFEVLCQIFLVLELRHRFY